MGRDINTEIYAGEHTLNQYVKYTDTFYALTQDGKLTVNKPLDDTCYLFYCIGDTLTQPRFAKIFNNDGVIDLDPDTGHLSLSNNNYMITYNQAGSVFAPSPISLYNIARNGASYPNGKRMGMAATLSEIPELSPCYNIATMYACLSIRCYMAQYTVNDDVYRFTDITERSVADVLAENDSYWNNHACLSMWAKLYIGDATTRSVVGGVGVSPSFGGDSFSCSLVDNKTVDRPYYSTETILQPAYNMASSYECLYQGALSDIAISDSTLPNDGDNQIIYWASANPSFFDIVCSLRSTGFSRFRTACFTKIKFQSAFNAYNCTGLYYFDNDSDASAGDPSGKPNAHRGKVSDDGKVNPNISDTNNNGLASDPEEMYTATGFNGNDDIDPNNYVDETPLEKPGLTALGVFNRTFAMNYNNLAAFANWVWNADADIFDQIVEGLKMLGENPLNGVIDVRLYPFDVGQLINSGGAENIKLGRITSDVQGIKVNGTDNAIINLGSCTFTKHFKSYLDFSPYTEARLYIPYCGVIPIDTVEFMGHELSAKMIVDLVTGACTVLLYKDKIITYTAQGVCGVSIPFTGTDSAAYAQSVLGSVFNSGVSLVGAKTVTGALDSVGGILQGLATPTQYVQGGSPSPSCGNWAPQYAYLIIDRPKPIPPEDYGHCVGYACEIYDTLNNFSGFTVVDNPDLSGIGATETEKEEIKRLLQEGVYL